jgi:hypothetical protein
MLLYRNVLRPAFTFSFEYGSTPRFILPALPVTRPLATKTRPHLAYVSVPPRQPFRPPPTHSTDTPTSPAPPSLVIPLSTMPPSRRTEIRIV